MKTPTTAQQTVIETPLGALRLVANPSALVGTWFVLEQKHGPSPERVTSWPSAGPHTVLDEATRQVEAYFRGTLTRFDLPLELAQGTPFQQQVWRALLDIPAGETTSYSELSRRIGRPRAVRAVGAAVGRNPLSIVVPCHRVLGAGGALTGYAGGLARKQALLLLERGVL